MTTGEKQVGRNDPCPCGSGLKHKNCCLRQQAAASAATGTRLSPTTAKRLREAQASRAKGDFARGEQLYRQILGTSPRGLRRSAGSGTSWPARGAARGCGTAAQRREARWRHARRQSRPG
ncbi:MAG: SEC-C metal-binding domain-containing protein [Phycisphaerales bacterium]